MEKVVKDGKVAVIVSPGFGAGWYSWNTDFPELLFHPKIVELVLENRHEEITEELIHNVLGISEEIYVGFYGVSALKVVWVPEGTAFRIDEYDGAEGLIELKLEDYFIA